MLKQNMVYFRIRHTFDGKLFHVSRFMFRDSPHIRLEIISWFTVHVSIFVSDILCGYFVRKVQILWFKFIIPVLSNTSCMARPLDGEGRGSGTVPHLLTSPLPPLSLSPPPPPSNGRAIQLVHYTCRWHR